MADRSAVELHLAGPVQNAATGERRQARQTATRRRQDRYQPTQDHEGGVGGCDDDIELAFALDLILDGLERRAAVDPSR